MSGDLFGWEPSASPTSSPAVKPAASPAPAGGYDPRSDANLRCPCGAWASFGFGTSALDNKAGVRRCRACAVAEGRMSADQEQAA